MSDATRGAAKVSVVMPVFNEVATVESALGLVFRQPRVAEVIVVDDFSTDGTFDLLTALAAAEGRLKLFRHGRNMGKGAALRTGVQKATAPIVLIQDADLEYDPADYAALVRTHIYEINQ
jgi:glycosyltransferase involved in cell wall biosynthesis